MTSSKSVLALQNKEIFEIAGRHVITWLKKQVKSFFQVCTIKLYYIMLC